MKFVYATGASGLSFDGIGSDLAITMGREPALRRWYVTRYALAEADSRDWRRYYDGVLPPGTGRVEWCGIFALWCLHQAGLAPSWRWELGKGFLYRLPLTTKPQPGDIAYVHNPSQHHAVVIDVEDGRVEAVNGNGGNATYTGDVVTRTKLPLAHYSSFYSIGPLLPKEVA
jgi:hypothetical protein